MCNFHQQGMGGSNFGKFQSKWKILIPKHIKENKPWFCEKTMISDQLKLFFTKISKFALL